MSISDDRLRHISNQDYIRSEAGQIAAELLKARQALRMFLACASDKTLNQYGAIIAAKQLLPPDDPDNTGWAP